MLKKSKILIIAIIIIISFIALSKIRKNNSSTQNNHEIKYVSGDYYFSLIHDGLKRRYLVHLPKNYNENILFPVVLAFHGGAGNSEKSPDYFQLNPKADKENFIVVYPEGTGIELLGSHLGSWNGGECCGPALRNNVDDIGFIKRVLEKLESDFNINTKKIYATGMSNGAIMSYALACEMSDQIAAIAPIGSIGHHKECNVKRPVPIMHFHGTNDPCAVYEGCKDCVGCTAKFLSKAGILSEPETMDVVSVPEYIQNWKKINKCSNETKITYQNKNAVCETFEHCQNNAEVTLCTIEGMGHTWPGRTTYSPKSCETRPNGFLCKTWKDSVGALNNDISANDAMWEFFKNHPMN